MSKSARILFLAVYVLTGLGIVMTYSASAVYANHVFGNAQYFLIRQALFVLIGTVLLFGVAAVPAHFWKDHSRGLILLAILLMGLVFVPVIGHHAGGARRWINLRILNFQPVEYAKVVVCIYLSDYLSRKIKFVRRGSLSVFFPPLLLIGAICVLTLLQPDLGSCVFIFIITAVLFFMIGIRLRYVAMASLVFIPVFYFLVIQVPYRLSRVSAFLNPWKDPQGSGFQIIQSFVAFSLGGWSGVGLGQSTQKLFYLPSSHTDFIFAVIGEELGLAGVLLVLSLYVLIFFCGIYMAEQATRHYERLLITSLTLLIVLQALINMLVATGLLPTKGLPLPFVSYGGTSVVFNLIAVGFLLGADRCRRRSV